MLKVWPAEKVNEILYHNRETSSLASWDNLDADYFHANWQELKSMHKAKRYLNGQTAQRIELDDKKMLSKLGVMQSNIALDCVGIMDEFGLLQAPIHFYKQPKKHFQESQSRFGRNGDMSQIVFSLNKKKRWLLPDIIKNLQDNEFEFDNQQTAKKFGLYSVRFSADRRQSSYISEYTDNKGRRVSGPPRSKINLNSIEKMYLTKAKNQVNGETRLHDPRRTGLKKRKRPYKRGNRDRNSGIKRGNESFVESSQTEKQSDEFITRQNFFGFWNPSCEKSKVLQSRSVCYKLMIFF